MIPYDEDGDPTAGVHIDEMRDGDIGQIVSWTPNSGYIGDFVQRYHGDLLVLGYCSVHHFRRFVDNNSPEVCRVRILRPGDRLVIAPEDPFPDGALHISEMRDGDVACVTGMPYHPVPFLAQRVGVVLVLLGIRSGASYPNAFSRNDGRGFDRQCLVKILGRDRCRITFAADLVQAGG